ncbi:MAG: hypothetical protein J5J00_02720 [Deltaproteobacteria bacterium]|nr:hypothetical protein [Deltaproteobacteria bacterium]
MKIVFLTTNSMTGIVSIQRFIVESPRSVEAILIFPNVPKGFGKGQKGGGILSKCRQIAVAQLFYKVLETWIYSAARVMFGRPTPARLAKKLGIRYRRFADPNDAETLEFLRSLQVDMIINVAPSLLREEILELPRIGCFNLHGAKLPSHRGVANHFWLLLEGAASSTATIHRMEKAVDTGNIFAEKEFSISDIRSVHHLNFVTQIQFHDLIRQLVDRISAKSIQGRPPTGESVYRSFPQNKDIKALKEKGIKLFTWKDFIESVKYQ